MVNLNTLSRAVKVTVTKFGLGSRDSSNSIPWGDADFLEAQDITTLTRNHLRRHLKARGSGNEEGVNVNVYGTRRSILSNRLQESLEQERTYKERIQKEQELKHREIANLEECGGAVYSIGTNHKGQLGLGDLNPRHVFTVIPQTRGLHIQEVSTGNDLVYAVNEEHIVWCWGSSGIGPMAMNHNTDNDNSMGSIDLSKAVKGFESPQRVDTLDEEDICSIAISSDTVCGISTSGDIYSWGSGQCGCLGNGMNIRTNMNTLTNTNTNTCHMNVQQHCPDLILSLVGHTKIQQISSGAMHYAALSKEGNVYCWGLGDSGRLGVEEECFLHHRDEKTMMRGGGEDDDLQEVGHHVRVHVGRGSKILSSPHIIHLPNNENIRMVSCGAEHTIAASWSKVYTWGNNDGGRLGLGDMIDRGQPCEIMKGLCGVEIIDISAGTWHSACIVSVPPMKGSGWVYTWGSGYKGQLGQGTKTISSLPAVVSFFCQNHLTTTRVFCGSHHNAVLTSDKELYTWGSNQNRCLGHDIDETLVNFTPTPGYCAGFGTIVNRIGRGFARSVALGKGYTIVATDRYMGPNEAEAIDLMEQHRIQVKEEQVKNAQELLKEQQREEFRRIINERENEVKFLAGKRECTLCDCKAFQVKSTQPSICRECGHSSIYHTLKVDNDQCIVAALI